MRGYSVFGCDISVRDDLDLNYTQVSVFDSEFYEYLQINEFQYCVNAMGSGDVAFSLNNPLADFEMNSYAVMRILEGLRKFQINCKFVHISSAAVYGENLELPIVELSRLSPISPYGYSKVISESICQEFYSCFGIPIVILRPFSVYGNDLRKQLLWDLCVKLTNSDSVVLFGTGEESRDFIHVNDFVRILELIFLKSDFNCRIYNVGNGDEVKISIIAAIFMENFQGKIISFNGLTKAGDPLNWRASIDLISNLGYSQSVDLKAGIIQYIEWFRFYSICD